MRLNQEQLDFYEENGYVVMENLLDADRIEQIKANASRMVAATPYGMNEGGVHWDKQIVEGAVTLPEDKRELGVFKLSHMQYQDDWFREYIMDGPEQDIVEQIQGPDIKLVAFQLIMKPPHYGQWQPYHQDSYYFPIDPPSCCGVWIALDEATVENGCLWVVPGSHKLGIVDHKVPGGEENKNINNAFYEAQGVEKDKGIPCPLKPGCGVMIHSKIFHMSGPNTTDSRRRGIVAHYANASWTFRDDVGEKRPEYMLVRGREYAGCI